jgi:short subunit dehydrogenase-like uncharacterized protein
MSHILIYGATGYTGRLIVEEAVRLGLRPVLSGRNPVALRELAAPHGLETRPATLEDPRALDAALGGLRAVLHCAGPFHRMAQPMLAACLRQRVHYLDITGEIAVFERMAASDVSARAAGITVLPGAGFDVVPSDCLAAHLHARMPDAVALELAFTGGTGLSRGTATTMVEGIALGGAIRRNGHILRVPSAYATRDIDFGDRLRHCVTIPWGDVSTAFYSTRIPDIRVYTAVPKRSVRMMQLTRPILPLLGTAPVQRLLKARIAARTPGPSAERRAGARSRLWGEVRDAAGRRMVSRLVAPDGYSLTAMTAVAAAVRVAAGGIATGFQTPSSAFGRDFILAFPDTHREDVV